jgi:uncharacterized membrane protein YccC
MPTKTKKPENRTGELEEHLSDLEQKRRLAGDAVTGATRRIEEIAARQQEIAVAVVSEDEEAVSENEQLEETLLLENRRRATARSAAQQLDAQLEQAKEALAEEKRREHLERAADLARKRYALESRAEEDISRLLATLSELEQLDRRHCHEMRLGGVEPPTEPLGWMVEEWLLTRLAAWVSENPRHQGFAAKDLPELDGLASEATPEDA